MVPYLDLKLQYAGIRNDIRDAIDRVLDSCQYILGEEVAAFEEEFSSYCRTEHAVAVNSGTSALHLALLAAGIGPGDEVITVPFTFVATVAAIVYTGARPVFVDVDPDHLTMDVSQVESAISPRTKAILPVFLFGQPVDMDPILEIARRRGITVIEDAAQAHGSEYRERRAGGIGDIGCFSFYPGKNLGAYGEGGAITTNDPEHARTVRMLRDWGQGNKHEFLLKGFNFRMDGIQGAVLRVKLKKLEEWTEGRRTAARRYEQLFDDLAEVRTPKVRSDVRHVYHVYAVRSAKRDILQRELNANGIQTGIHYPSPVHLLTAHSDLGYGPGRFPCAEAAANEVLSLPMFPELTSEQQEEVVAAVRAAVRS